MGVSWSGLASGIERGVGLGLALDQNQQAKEDRIYTRGLQERQMVLSEASNERQIDSHEVNMAVANMELDEFRDQNKRTAALNSINAQQHAVEMYQQNLNDGVYKTQAELQAATAQLNQGNLDLMNQLGNKLINKNNASGEDKKLARMYPHAPSGKLLFEVEITDKDGNKVLKPVTVGRSADPADPVALVAPEDLTKHLAKAKQILTDLDRMAIRRGDTGPIDRMRAGAEQTEERAYDEKQATVAHKRGLQTKAFEQNIKGLAGPSNSEYGSTEDTLKDFFFKLDDNGQQVLEPDKAPDYALALSRLQTRQQANPNTPPGVLASEVYQEYLQLGDLESFRAQAAQELQGTGADGSWWPGNQPGGGAPEAIEQRAQELYNASRQNWLHAPAPGGQAPTGLNTQAAPSATAAPNAPGATAQPPSNWKAPPAAKPYVKTITAAEQANNLPPGLLGRLLQQESGFNAKAVGPETKDGQAQGIAQIMPKWHPDVDPSDSHASIAYGANYLAELYKEFGTWEEALAAYNWGPGNLREKGMINAPAETRRYVAAIMQDMGGSTTTNSGDYPKPTAEHLAALRAKPEMADQFKAKFGYLPSAGQPAKATGATGSMPGIADAAAADAPPSLPPAGQGSPGMAPMGYAGVQGLPGGQAGGMGLRANPPPTGARRGLTFDSGSGERRAETVNALGSVGEYFSASADSQRAVDNVRQLLRGGKAPRPQDAQAQYDIETALESGLLSDQETQQLTALLRARA